MLWRSLIPALATVAVLAACTTTTPPHDGGQTIKAAQGSVPPGYLTITNLAGTVLVEGQTGTFNRNTYTVPGGNFDGGVVIKVVDNGTTTFRQTLRYRSGTAVTLHYWSNLGQFLLEDNTIDYG